jgi:lipoyl(octanoyl) transferase
LAIYPIVPLEWHGWTVGEYLRRFQAGICSVLEALRVPAEPIAGRRGLWGRTGQLVLFGVAVRNWVTYHGAFVNVDPAMRLMRAIESDPAVRGSMSSLMIERQQPVKISHVRSLIVAHLAGAFGCGQSHVYSRHPLYSAVSRRVTSSRRVG